LKLLNRKNLLATKFTAQEESRYTINGILITENETVGTDGHILARVSLPTDVYVQDFPTIEGFTPNGFKSAVLPSKTAQELEKAIPKSKYQPILNHAAVTEHDGKLQLAVTDLESPRVITARPVEGTFPNWQAVFEPPTQEVNYKMVDKLKVETAELEANLHQRVPVPVSTDITLSAELLKRLADAVSKFSDKDSSPVRLRFYGADHAVRFDAVNSDGQELNGLLMPMRTELNGKSVKPVPTFKP
jgi:hypothetical protein